MSENNQDKQADQNVDKKVEKEARQQTAEMVHGLRKELEDDSQNDLFDQHEPGFAARQLHRIFNWFSKVDTREVSKRVENLRQEFPEAGQEQLIEQLIRRKCEQTARIGAATAATGAIPVLGTMFSLTLGMVLDLGAVITSQAELVLEIAEVHGIKMSEAKKRETVFLVMGLGTGAQRLGTRASQQVLNKLAQRYARRWISHAIPVLGIAAAAAVNALSTYLIGRRAQAYFAQGPQAMGDWKSSLRALTGFDELKISDWLQNIHPVKITENLTQNLGQNFSQLTPDKLTEHLPPHVQTFANDVIEKGKGLADQALDFSYQALERLRKPTNTQKKTELKAEADNEPITVKSVKPDPAVTEPEKAKKNL